MDMTLLPRDELWKLRKHNADLVRENATLTRDNAELRDANDKLIKLFYYCEEKCRNNCAFCIHRNELGFNDGICMACMIGASITFTKQSWIFGMPPDASA